MKKLMTSLLALVGLAGAAQTPPKTQNVDPRTILFSTPTLSDDIAPLVPINGKPAAGDLVFHEDEWSQIEFLPRSQLGEAQRLLKEYKTFEQANRVPQGWRNVYVRKLQRVPVLPGTQSVQQLESLLEAKAGAAPILFATSAVGGRVQSGFSLSLGGNVTLYGQLAGQQVEVLGAYLGDSADDTKLTAAFMKLNASNGIFLVDWRRQMILLSVTAAGQIDIWKP
jgi:hypothetical protein